MKIHSGPHVVVCGQMDTQTWQSEKVHFAILIVNTPKKGDEK
jgi:hypothetical protein